MYGNYEPVDEIAEAHIIFLLPSLIINKHYVQRLCSLQNVFIIKEIMKSMILFYNIIYGFTPAERAQIHHHCTRCRVRDRAALEAYTRQNARTT